MYSKSNLNKLAHISELAPEATTAFQEWDKAALADRAISKQCKQLMSSPLLSPLNVRIASNKPGISDQSRRNRKRTR